MITDAKNKLYGALYGHAIGDALGVPVEFKSRNYLESHPVTDYTGYGCWNQPPGTFSDDSSMMFCTAQSLCGGYNLENIGSNFVKWYKHGYWGAYDEVFDIGNTTRFSLDRLVKGESALYSGEFEEYSNGNGSLMRILPLVFYLYNEADIEKRYGIVKEVSAITHAHFRSVFSCFVFVTYGIALLRTGSLREAYAAMQQEVHKFIAKKSFNTSEVALFERVLKADVSQFSESSIQSSGYVLHSLESSLWCLLTTTNYNDAVLKAVNLGGDTDTTGAITGGLAGLYYGLEDIPVKYRLALVKTKEIGSLCGELLTVFI